MYQMSEEQKKNRKVIETKGSVKKKHKDFVNDLFEAFKEGYIPTDSRWSDDSTIIRPNRRRVVLYKEGYEVSHPKSSGVVARDYLQEAKEADAKARGIEPEVVVEEDTVSDESQEVFESVVEEKVSTKADALEELNTKEDLISFAKENELTFTKEEAKYPKKLKKVLAEQL